MAQKQNVVDSATQQKIDATRQRCTALYEESKQEGVVIESHHFASQEMSKIRYSIQYDTERGIRWELRLFEFDEDTGIMTLCEVDNGHTVETWIMAANNSRFEVQQQLKNTSREALFHQFER